MTDRFPYQDLSLKSIKGEIWRPVPDFEDRYEISSLGRVKSLAWERVLHHGGIMCIAARILRTPCRTVRNHSIGENLYTLMVTLYLEGKSYSFSVGRLVYHAFIEPFDLKDKAIFISYKDGEGRNLNYKNLFRTNISDLSNASYEKGRYISKLRKPVSQFDVEGNLVAQFASMYEAGRVNGIGERAIANAAGGNHILYKGFVWQSGHSKILKKGKLVQKIEAGINEALQPTVGAGPMPSANLSLINIKGEVWKDFPGYEGLYRISNFGRVKALRKISEGKQKKWYPECIKKLTATNKRDTPDANKTTLIATLCKGQQKRTHHVARFVFYLFVKPFDLHDRKLRVYYKDGNPHNLHYKNLMLKNAAWSITGNNINDIATILP
jgi:hypothetical protein